MKELQNSELRKINAEHKKLNGELRKELKKQKEIAEMMYEHP